MTKETLEKAKKLEDKICNLRHFLEKTEKKQVLELTDKNFEENIFGICFQFSAPGTDWGETVTMEEHEMSPKVKAKINEFYFELLRMCKTEIDSLESEFECL